MKRKYSALCVCMSKFICIYMLMCVCVHRWLWSARAVKTLPVWTSWWKGSSTAAASPAVRKVPKRGQWCSCIQQTTAWTLHLYPTPWVGLSLILCPIQIHTLISMLAHTQTITHYRIHQTEGSSVLVWLFVSLCSSSPPFTLLHTASFVPISSIVKALWKYHFTLC